ncbi:MAG: hypothetical protein WC707_01370 [Candidatus Babeliaceae bacterium]|jgi:hypothetical protein
MYTHKKNIFSLKLSVLTLAILAGANSCANEKCSNIGLELVDAEITHLNQEISQLLNGVVDKAAAEQILKHIATKNNYKEIRTIKEKVASKIEPVDFKTKLIRYLKKSIARNNQEIAQALSGTVDKATADKILMHVAEKNICKELLESAQS